MAQKQKTFPKTLYVRIDKPQSDDAYFSTYENMYSLAEHGETVKIATYQLVRVDDVELVMDIKQGTND